MLSTMERMNQQADQPAWQASGAIDLAAGLAANHLLFAQVLDEIDYGVVCVTASRDVIHTNRTARVLVRQSELLAMEGRRLRALDPLDADRLGEAIRAASARQLRRMVSFGSGPQRLAIAVLPLASDAPGSLPVLLIMGKQNVCERLSTYWFGVSQGLTPAERTVLECLADGLDPADIALRQRVAISTVRTQIASVRMKTGTENIGALLREIAQLPPLLTALGAHACS